MYRFEFIEGRAVFDLGVLVFSKERRPKATNNRLSIAVLHGESSHLHPPLR